MFSFSWNTKPKKAVVPEQSEPGVVVVSADAPITVPECDLRQGTHGRHTFNWAKVPVGSVVIVGQRQGVHTSYRYATCATDEETKTARASALFLAVEDMQAQQAPVREAVAEHVLEREIVRSTVANAKIRAEAHVFSTSPLPADLEAEIVRGEGLADLLARTGYGSLMATINERKAEKKRLRETMD